MLATPLLLFAILAAEDAPKAKEPLGKDTTYFTGPLDKEGYVDYQAALNEHLGKGITPKTNANVLIWKALGPTPEGRKVPAEFFKLLGIEEPSADGVYLIKLPTYLKDHTKLDRSELTALMRQQSDAGERPWKKQDYPHIAAWLAANEKPLVLAIEATRRPDYFNPLVTQRSDGRPGRLVAASPNVHTSLELVRALTARAMLRVGAEKYDEAWQDLLASHRLGRLVARGATLLEALVGIAVDGIASGADLAYLERSDPTQALGRLKDLQALPPMPPMVDKIDLGERILFLDYLQFIRRGNKRVDDLDSAGPARKASAAELKALDTTDWTPVLRNCNRWYDRIVAAMRLEDRGDQQKELAKIDDNLGALGHEPTGIKGLAKLLQDAVASGKPTGELAGNALIQWMLPAEGAAQNAQDRVEQTQRNLHVAFALAAYRRDHEHYPAKLDELAPKYLAKVPNDLFSAKPLVYVPAEKSYLLYSVGRNGKDEQGRRRTAEPPGDDLSVQMPLPELKPVKPKTAPLPLLPLPPR